jgi:hypothetical protein
MSINIEEYLTIIIKKKKEYLTIIIKKITHISPH